MDQERERSDQATSVEEPAETPPDEGLAYDPAMTDADEANIPEDSDADPQD
jgi:hypothetical protein